MSKLDNIILDCANKVLDGKEEKLGDYIDPTKEQVKALMLELIDKKNLRSIIQSACDKRSNVSVVDTVEDVLNRVAKKVEKL